MELLLTELSKHNTKVTELQAKLQQIQASKKQLARDEFDLEKELSFEAGVISSLEFSINITQQEETNKQNEDSEK